MSFIAWFSVFWDRAGSLCSTFDFDWFEGVPEEDRELLPAQVSEQKNTIHGMIYRK